MSFIEQPGFADDVRSVLTDLLALPPSFLDYTVQYNALNGLPIPVSQLTGFAKFTAEPATTVATSESTSSTTYADLATVGPSITGLSDGHYLILFGCFASTDADGFVSRMSVDVNGGGAVDGDSCATGISHGISLSRAITKTLSNNNSSTITAKYKTVTAAHTSTFQDRWMLALRYSNL